MKARNWLAVAALGVAAAGAQAQGLYAEVGYSGLKAKANGFSVKPDGLRFMLGYEYNDYLAAEGMLGLGLNDDSVNTGPTTVTAELKNSYGLFVKPKLKLGNDFEVFARLGWARSKMSASSTSGASGSQSATDFAYGVGVSYQVNKSWSVNADYMNYFSKDGLKVNGYTLGVGMKF